MKQVVAKPPAIAMSGIILSMMLMAVASGLIYAYVPIKLKSLGFEPWVLASMVPATAFGGFIGCFATGWMLRISGHARVFMVLHTALLLSYLFLLVSDHPIIWLFGRAIYGLGAHGVFIVAQSWLHDATTDEKRGQVMSVLYVSFLFTLGVGSFWAGQIGVEGETILILAILFAAMAVFPVGLTKLPQPPLPDQVAVEIKRVWKISPVGLVGMFCVGGMTFTLVTFAPIYASELEFTPQKIGLLMMMMQIGLIVIQVPMGALSDKIDRRYVLLMVCGMAAVMAVIAIIFQSTLGFLMLALVFAIWVGANDTIYSVSSALANDRADPQHYVFLASTQMVAWSSGGFILPLLATGLLTFFPITIFMWVLLAVTIIFAAFVVYRIIVGRPVPEDPDTSYVEVPPVVHPGGMMMVSTAESDGAGSSEWIN